MSATVDDFTMWEQELWGDAHDLCVHAQPTVGCETCCPCAACRNRRAS